MPVAHLSAELCVLSVLSCGHFFQGLDAHPALDFLCFRFSLFCLQTSDRLSIHLVSWSRKCPKGQCMSLRPSQWGLPSTPRLGTWGEQSSRRHFPGVQHSAPERAPSHPCQSLGPCLALVLGLDFRMLDKPRDSCVALGSQPDLLPLCSQGSSH